MACLEICQLFLMGEACQGMIRGVARLRATRLPHPAHAAHHEDHRQGARCQQEERRRADEVRRDHPDPQAHDRQASDNLPVHAHATDAFHLFYPDAFNVLGGKRAVGWLTICPCVDIAVGLRGRSRLPVGR